MLYHSIINYLSMYSSIHLTIYLSIYLDTGRTRWIYLKMVPNAVQITPYLSMAFYQHPLRINPSIYLSIYLSNYLPIYLDIGRTLYIYLKMAPNAVQIMRYLSTAFYQHSSHIDPSIYLSLYSYLSIYLPIYLGTGRTPCIYLKMAFNAVQIMPNLSTVFY